MFYYIIPYFFLLLGTILVKNYKIQKQSLFFLLFMFLTPAILLVVLRGNIGTDTLQYLRHFGSLSSEFYINVYEPGFNILTATINLFEFNDHIDVAIIGFLTIYLLCKSYSNSKESLLLFSLLLFPIFFYELTMNTLRAGLAFALANIAIDFLTKKKYFAFSLFSILSISMQYSSFMIIVVFLIFKLDKKYLLALIIFITILFTFGFNFIADNIAYLYNKQDAYKDIVAPSGTSGLVPLFLFLLIFASFIFYSPRTRSNNILVLILVLEILSFALAKISYAGLRFQLLFLFTLILFIKQEQHILINKKAFLRVMFFLGFLGFMVTIKNITAINEDAEASFIPYKFFWNEI